MNCHYSAHGTYTCINPKIDSSKFSNAYFVEG